MKKILLLFALIIVLVGCEDSSAPIDYGTISVQNTLKHDAYVSIQNTVSGDTQFEDYVSKGGGVSISVPVGEYRITALSNMDFYGDDKVVSVKKGMTISISIPL